MGSPTWYQLSKGCTAAQIMITIITFRQVQVKSTGNEAGMSSKRSQILPQTGQGWIIISFLLYFHLESRDTEARTIN